MDFQTIDEGRERLGITQTDLCREARVAHSTYQRIRKGEVSPTVRTLNKLRTALAAISLGQTERAA